MSMQWSWFRPRSLDETVGVLLEHGRDAVLVAGGTALSLSPPRREKLSMVDLQHVGLSTIDDRDREVRLGSMVTAQQLVRACEVDAVGAGMLHDTCTTMGPRPVRNRITVGGNVMQSFRWCDLPVSLLALDARFEIYGPESSSRTVSADELFAAQPRKSLGQGELLASVSVDKDTVGQAGAFIKLAMTSVDHALVSAAVRLTMQGETCTAARVAVGALTAIPQRLESVEKGLIDHALDASTISEASQPVRDASVHGDRRADETYRRDMAVVIVRRAIETAVVRARVSQQGGGAC